MSEQSVKITPTGKRNATSQGHEVLLIGAARANGLPFEARAEMAPEGWEVISDVGGGPEFGSFSFAFRGLHGRLELETGTKGRLAFITHPWSGMAQVEVDGRSIEIDLYSAETSVVILDLANGESAKASAGVLKRIALRPPRSDQPSIRRKATTKARENELVITALGEQSPQSVSAEVILLHVEPFGLGVAADLTVYQGPEWQRAADIVVDGKGWTGGLKGLKGELRMDCSSSGVVTLLRHEWSGVVEISYGGTSLTVDLYAPRPAVLTLRLDELDMLAFDPPADLVEPLEAPMIASQGQDGPRRGFYQRLTKSFDRDKPVGLYVPRWHGVAASTRALFDQTLPIPPGVSDHPDDITEEDIREYADMLVDSGCRHFVISGGDLFNLRIIDRVLERAPETRFDQLWHSNFLQMGEPHDWNLLRHWLVALRDGTVTRIGVVKEGLTDWFSQFGIDSVFIPNVIEFDTSKVKASKVSDTVGIWLSGSSSYRKLPHAALMALKMVPNVALMGAGLDPKSMQMINDLKLPFRQISADPLPQSQMFNRMRKTGLTLYVTVSECSPMVPLESFALGVPCLVGPSSHIFRSHDLLREALVVKNPHSPAEIAEKMAWALGHQEELFEAYLSYYEDERKMAVDGVARLIA